MADNKQSEHGLDIDTLEYIDDKIENAVRRRQRRTVFLSIIAAGVVGLFIGHGVEVSSNNEQATRSVKNCVPVHTQAVILGQVANSVSQSSPDPSIKKRWAGYSRVFYGGAPPHVPTCKELFPHKNVFWIK